MFFLKTKEEINENIERSMQWVRDNIGVEPEVFSYRKTTSR